MLTSNSTFLTRSMATAFMTVIIAVMIIPSTSNAADTCPVQETGETALDCPWASDARAYIQMSESGQDIASEFASRSASIKSQINRDVKTPALFSLWGKSINFDSRAEEIIVDPTILSHIGTLAGIEMQGKYVHAGLEHTYGYLFSTIETPFGYKRARWVSNDIETGLGLEAGTIGPNADAGTLLSNITWLAGKFAFTDEISELETLNSISESVHPSLLDLNAGQFTSHKFIETFEAEVESTEKGEDSVLVNIEISTDIVEFNHEIPGSSNEALLIYSIRDSRVGTWQLITAFPIAKPYGESLRKCERMVDEAEIKTRYNGYVESITGSVHVGNRRVTVGECFTPAE